MIHYKKKYYGFTLLEVLIVASLIAAISFTVIMSLDTNNDTKQLEQEARRFIGRVELIAEQAILRSEAFGLSVDNNQYYFMVRGDDNKWQIIEDDPLFQRVDLRYFAQLSLKLDAFNRSGNDQQIDYSLQLNNEYKPRPQVLIAADGTITAFELVFKLQQEQDPYNYITVKGRSSGLINIVSPAGE